MVEHIPALKAELVHCCSPSSLLHTRAGRQDIFITERCKPWVIGDSAKETLPGFGLFGEVGMDGNKVRVQGVAVKTAVVSNVVRKRATVLEDAP